MGLGASVAQLVTKMAGVGVDPSAERMVWGKGRETIPTLGKRKRRE